MNLKTCRISDYIDIRMETTISYGDPLVVIFCLQSDEVFVVPRLAAGQYRKTEYGRLSQAWTKKGAVDEADGAWERITILCGRTRADRPIV